MPQGKNMIDVYFIVNFHLIAVQPERNSIIIRITDIAASDSNAQVPGFDTSECYLQRSFAGFQNIPFFMRGKPLRRCNFRLSIRYFGNLYASGAYSHIFNIHSQGDIIIDIGIVSQWIFHVLNSGPWLQMAAEKSRLPWGCAWPHLRRHPGRFY